VVLVLIGHGMTTQGAGLRVDDEILVSLPLQLTVCDKASLSFPPETFR
jgi:hypothetical protein